MATEYIQQARFPPTYSFISKASWAAEILAWGFLSLQAFCITMLEKDRKAHQ